MSQKYIEQVPMPDSTGVHFIVNNLTLGGVWWDEGDDTFSPAVPRNIAIFMHDDVQPICTIDCDPDNGAIKHINLPWGTAGNDEDGDDQDLSHVVLFTTYNNGTRVRLSFGPSKKSTDLEFELDEGNWKMTTNEVWLTTNDEGDLLIPYK